ncbi:hypothetical protein DEO72_LG4g1084 [Vigna unguiculata]|uniref:Thioredoxin-like fold n=1 Tax=Vigna unguiculata TaxID=3917 RepID=A0A4D6LNP0_VIGUN|nr:hypothetical protein DEO72_LG4g1084 [Vigna unguiculata]
MHVGNNFVHSAILRSARLLGDLLSRSGEYLSPKREIEGCETLFWAPRVGEEVDVWATRLFAQVRGSRLSETSCLTCVVLNSPPRREFLGVRRGETRPGEERIAQARRDSPKRDFADKPEVHTYLLSFGDTSESTTTSGKVRRGMTTSGQVRVSIINPESMANFVVKLEVEKLWGLPFLFVYDDDRVIRYTGAGDVEGAHATE